MPTRVRVRPAHLLLLLCLAVTGAAAWSSQTSEAQPGKSKYPVVDYDAPEPADPAKRELRRKRGKKHNDGLVKPSPEVIGQFTNIHFPYDITALPFSKSAAVIVGKVTDAHAHLSPDKTGIYSEFDVAVEEVIKNDSQAPLSAGNTVAAQRPGGRLRLPTGQIQEYETNLRPLQVGCRYVLFLDRIDEDYQVFTGYLLEAGKVSPLDTLPIFARYKGVAETTFLEELRKLAAATAYRGREGMPTTWAQAGKVRKNHPTPSRSPEESVRPSPAPHPQIMARPTDFSPTNP